MKLIPLLRVVVVPFSLAAVSCSSDSTEPGSPTGAAGSSTSSSSSASSSTGAAGSPASSSMTSASSSSATSSTSAGNGGAGGSDTSTSSGASGAGGAATTGSAGSGGAGGGSGGSGGTGGSGPADGGVGGSGGKGGAGGGAPVDGGASPMMNFFVSSDTSMTGNLGGLMGADMRCQRLATAVGAGGKTWRAYLSAMTPATNARDRIGDGPYYNSAGALLAMTKDALHMRSGDPALFITEKGIRISGQWGKVNPMDGNEHDILTGATREGGILMNSTCGDWMSTNGSSGVGHSDGMGPGMATTGTYPIWNASHTGQCANTIPGGGAGRIYCFVGP